MRCEVPDCPKRVRFKTSLDDGVTRLLCGRHTVRYVKEALHLVSSRNCAIYIQRAVIQPRRKQ